MAKVKVIVLLVLIVALVGALTITVINSRLERDPERMKKDIERRLQRIVKIDDDHPDYAPVSEIEALIRKKGKKAVPVYVELFGDGKRSRTELRILSTILGLGMKSREAVPGLIKILEDENQTEEVRNYATETLGDIGDERAIKPLIHTLETAKYKVRKIQALRLLKAKEAVEPLIKLLNDPAHINIRGVIGNALANIGTKRAIEGLIMVLETKVKIKDGEIAQWSAAMELGNLGAKEAIPALERALNDAHGDVRKYALEALLKLKGKEKVTPLIVKMLKEDEDVMVRARCASLLGKIGAKETIPDLMDALRNDECAVQQCAARVLGSLEAKEAIPLLIIALEDEDKIVRNRAAKALKKLTGKDYKYKH